MVPMTTITMLELRRDLSYYILEGAAKGESYTVVYGQARIPVATISPPVPQEK